MHACHQELVIASVLHNAFAACSRFRLVHVLIRIDFGIVLLQSIAMHQVSDYKQV